MYSIDALNVVNVVRYIPVEEAIIGWNPSAIKSGTKAAPGPIPQKAVAIDPKNAAQDILKMFNGVASRSPSTNSKLQATFSLYSDLTLRTPMIKMIIAMTYKSANINQSVPLHLIMSTGEILPLPLM